MRGPEDQKGRSRRDHDQFGLGDPEDRRAAQNQIAQRATAHGRQRGHEDETDDVELLARGDKRPGQRKDQNRAVIQRPDIGADRGDEIGVHGQAPQLGMRGLCQISPP